MSNSVDTSEPSCIGICHSEGGARNEVSIFVTMAPNLTEPYSRNRVQTISGLRSLRLRRRLLSFQWGPAAHVPIV